MTRELDEAQLGARESSLDRRERDTARRGDLGQLHPLHEAKREGAIHTLKFMKERGVLLALRNEAGPHQEAARQAYFELLNQKIVTGVTMPEDDKK